MKDFFKKVWSITKKLWFWLVLSSENPKKYSLTIKAVLTAALTAASMFAGLAHIQLPSAELTAFIDTIVSIVQQLLGLIAMLAGLVGLVQKIGSTYQGTNQVVNTHPAFTEDKE